MKFIKYLVLVIVLSTPINIFAGGTPPGLSFLSSDSIDREVYAYYDLRDRKTFIQVTNQLLFDGDDDLDSKCIHVQIFQQDKGCTELDFEDELTHNDTVIYDMDNLIRNDGSEVPVNLDENSYGFVAITSFVCENREGGGDALIGNFRIVDDTGYEYRMNLVSGDRERGGGQRDILSNPDRDPQANIIIPFNTIDGASYADLVAFVVNDQNDLSCSTPSPTRDDAVCNDPAGATFSVFLVDENEERLSCDQKNFACGANKVMNYGINEDYKNSRGGPLLCEGGGLLPGQTHGYISLENATYNTTIPNQRASEFICIIGINNNNGTGSMDSCHLNCIDDNNCDTE